MNDIANNNEPPKMAGFWWSIKTCFRKYAQFKGRATRAEFWWFALFALAVEFLALLLAPNSKLQLLWDLAVLLPSLAVGARRLHDIGRSGWWQLLYLTIVGIPLLLILFCIKTKSDEEIATQDGWFKKIENRIAAWRGKSLAGEEAHPIRFVGFWWSVKNCFIKYARFRGRATRAEFWWFALFATVVGVVTLVINPNGLLNGIWNLAVLLPSLAVGARRLHDIGRSGWWQLLYLTIVGIPLLLILFYIKTKSDEEIAAQDGWFKKIENRIAAWRAKSWVYAKAHPFRFAMWCVVALLIVLLGIYILTFTIFHIFFDCPPSVKDWIKGGVIFGLFFAAVFLSGGTAALPGLGSLGVIGKMHSVMIFGFLGSQAHSVYFKFIGNMHPLFCFYNG